MVLLITVAVLLVVAFLYFRTRKEAVEDGLDVALTKLTEEEKDLYEKALHPEQVAQTFIYALTTCAHCRKTRALLEENNVPFILINIDSYPKALNSILSDKMREYNPRGSFPTIRLTNGQIITGYRENSLKEALINDPS